VAVEQLVDDRFGPINQRDRHLGQTPKSDMTKKRFERGKPFTARLPALIWSAQLASGEQRKEKT
jgi:hypothetical protein